MVALQTIPSIDGSVLVSAVLTLVVAALLARLSTVGLKHLSQRMVERRITIRMFVPLVKFCIYGAAVYFVLGPILNLTPAQLLAVSGLLGAALGFGLQDLVANVIGGLALLVERPYQVGDKVEIGDHYGEVVDIGLRSTSLQTPGDSTVVVPNYQFVTDSIVNANSGAPEMLVVVEFHVAQDTDPERAMTIVENAIATSKFVYVSEDCPFTVLVEDEPYYRTVRGKAYVNDLRNEFAFESDVTERVLTAFDDAGIDGPSARGVVTES